MRSTAASPARPDPRRVGVDPVRESGDLAALGRRIAYGAGWVVGLRFALRALGLVSTVILARLLLPADFGLIALATLLAAAVERLGAFNFDVWLVRHPDPGAADYDTVWTLSIIRGLASGALLVALAHPVSGFFDEPRLAAVVAVLGVASAAGAFENVGIVDFRKHLQLHRDFLLMMACKVGAFVVTVSLAVALRSYWALLAGIITNYALRLALSFRLHPFRPRLSLHSWREAFDFSKWLLVSNTLAFVYNRADTFILGKLVSSQVLGLYAVAHELANLAATELVQPIRRALLPGYAKMIDDPAQLRRGFVDGFGIIMLIGAPCAVGIALLADPLVRTLLGDNWLEAIPIVQVLALYALAAVGMANINPVLMAVGRTRLLAVLFLAGVLVLVPAFTWATHSYGVLGGAWALGVTNTLAFLASLFATMKILGVAARDVLGAVWRVAPALAVLAVTVTAVRDAPAVAALWPGLVLLAGVLAGAAAYVAACLGLWRLAGAGAGPERAVLDFVRRRAPAAS